MITRENKSLSIRLSLAGISCIAVTVAAGCGSGAGTGMTVTRVSVGSTPAMSSPTPTPVPDNVPGQPASQLADLSRGAVWEYALFPGEADSGHSKPSSSASRHRRVALVPAGSPLAVAAGHAATDIRLPGALIRLVGTTTTATGSDLGVLYRYDGTYRQDTATRDVYLLRLPDGRPLDSPARVLPGTWERGMEVKSRFVVTGEVKAEYRLTVGSLEVLDTLIGRNRVWLTNVNTKWFEPENKGHFFTAKQWFDPAAGSYLKSASCDTATILNDLTVIEILEDEKLSFYKVNP